jgi:hypothetical protein
MPDAANSTDIGIGIAVPVCFKLRFIGHDHSEGKKSLMIPDF